MHPAQVIYLVLEQIRSHRVFAKRDYPQSDEWNEADKWRFIYILEIMIENTKGGDVK